MARRASLASDGQCIRQDSAFRHWVGADSGAEFAAQPGRYHLYVSLARPWAHRTLNRLENVIGATVVEPRMGRRSWDFGDDVINQTDPLSGDEYLHEPYLRVGPHYTGHVTVPVLWDRARHDCQQ